MVYTTALAAEYSTPHDQYYAPCTLHILFVNLTSFSTYRVPNTARISVSSPSIFFANIWAFAVQ